MHAPDRRQFLRLTALATAGTALAPLSRALAQVGNPASCGDARAGAGFGRLQPSLPENASELGRTIIGDLRRVPLLDLPSGFSCRVLSITGQRMDDGALTPALPDGMACFGAADGGHVLVRNHELQEGDRAFGNAAGCRPADGRVYDPFRLPIGMGGGGTSTLRLDAHGRLLGQHVSLGGTLRNCAGGATTWGSWLSCEESVETPAGNPRVTRRHGYLFEVPARFGATAAPVPIIAAGRFNREAVALDPATGRLFQTEDRPDSCVYRYTPTNRPGRVGDLHRGGALHALAVDLDDTPAGCDDRLLPMNADGGADTRMGVTGLVGRPLRLRWLPLHDIDPGADTLREEARTAGAALFARGEGAWFGNGLVYFVCTSGGDAGAGQVWAIDPARDTLTLLLESPGRGLLDHPDNITVGPDGSLYLMEDGYGEQFVMGVDRAGGVFPLARNALRRPDRGGAPDTAEFAGGCFSADGRLFFVNSQGIGITYAVFRDDGAVIAPAAS